MKERGFLPDFSRAALDELVRFEAKYPIFGLKLLTLKPLS